MGLLLANRAVLDQVGDFIKLTTDQSSLQTVGILLVFSSGNLQVDWGDGSPIENFVSVVELTHSYSSTGTYIIKIKGDLENITQFIADNSRITTITGMRTGLLTDLRLHQNLLSGVLDLSLAPLSGVLFLYQNSLTDVIFAPSGNGTLTASNISFNNFTSLDLTNLPISGQFIASGNASLSNITFASSNGVVTVMNLAACNFITLDFSNLKITSTLNVDNNSLTNITFFTGNGNLTDILATNNNFTYLNTLQLDTAINNISWVLNNSITGVDNINHLLVDIDSKAVGGFTGRNLALAGTNPAPDSTSGGFDGLAAKTSLISKGFTVATN